MKDQTNVGFVYVVEAFDKHGRSLGRDVVRNKMPKEMLNYMLSTAFKGVPGHVQWYAGLYSGNYAPSGDETMQRLPAAAVEFTGYDGASRPQVMFGDAANARIDNSESLIELTFTQDVEIFGGFLATSAAKGATTGLCGSVVRFPAPKRPGIGGVMRVAVSQELVS